ncbi:hypothetical protein C8Q79DRAFT_1009887 [Trametes meyenii]|nr:hypothetical protein C8Q79DRAFT_1009887 [Trametes meyenii]
MPVQLTPANACRRIRTPTDDAILTANPIVRIFTLDPIPPRDSGSNEPAHRALITDGWTFTYIRVASTFSSRIGWGFDQLHAGAAVELTDIVRLDVASPESDGCPVQVNGLAIKYTDADADADVQIDGPDPLLALPEDVELPVRALIAHLTAQRDKCRRLTEHVLEDFGDKFGPGGVFGDALLALERIGDLDD